MKIRVLYIGIMAALLLGFVVCAVMADEPIKARTDASPFAKIKRTGKIVDVVRATTRQDKRVAHEVKPTRAPPPLAPLPTSTPASPLPVPTRAPQPTRTWNDCMYCHGPHSICGPSGVWGGCPADCTNP